MNILVKLYAYEYGSEENDTKDTIDIITELLPMISLFCIVLFLLRFFILKIIIKNLYYIKN